jgi:putative peptidoglycan lipid II flippase
MQVLSYKVPGYDVRQILGSIARMVIAAALMGEVVWLVARQVGGNAGADAVLRLVVGAIAGCAVYLGILVALRAPELDAVRRRLPRP